MPALPKARARLFAPLSYGGIVGALVFFGFSLTPSLLPRSPLLQGLVSGLSVAGGYGLGALVFWAGAKATAWRPTRRGRRFAWLALAVAGIAFVVPALYVGGVWNNETRALMTLEPVSPWTPAAALPIALLIWFVLLVIARLLRWAARAVGNLLSRWLPRIGAIVLGAVIVAVPLLVVFSGLLSQASSLADSVYGKTNDTTAEGVTQPTSALRSGGRGRWSRGTHSGSRAATSSAAAPTGRPWSSSAESPPKSRSVSTSGWRARRRQRSAPPSRSRNSSAPRPSPARCLS